MSALARPRTSLLQRVLDVDAHEGPVYLADEDALYFTTLPVPGRPVAIKRVQLDGERFPLGPENVSVVVPDAARANGMTADGSGGLLVCEQGERSRPARISRVDVLTGERETVVDQWRGLPLNSPNDVIADSAGTIWFTDPSYGHLQGFRPEPAVGDYVYRHNPGTGETTVVADAFDKPNGIALSPDETVLYVTDSGANQEPGSYHVDRPHHIKAFDVVGGRRLAGERLFAAVAPGFPDGLKVDANGRVYSSSASGVQIFNCFGGLEHNLLFITTDSAVWVAALSAKGA